MSNDPYLHLLDPLKRREPSALKKHFLKNRFAAAALNFPYAVAFQSIKDGINVVRSEFKKDLDKQNPKRLFKNGQIPIKIREEAQLVDEDSEEGRAFQEQMQTIITRLIGSDYDEKVHQFRFFISDKNIVNCSIVPFSKPPIIMVTKALIEKCTTEDELASVLAHELGHWEMFRRVGLHKNSNPEEAGSDVWSVKLLQDAGYKTSAMMNVFQMFKKEYRGGTHPIQALLNILDPHPPLDIRIRNVENAMAVVEHSKKLNTAETPLSSTLRKCAKEGKYNDPFEKLKKQYGFDGKTSLKERVGVIEEMMFHHFIGDHQNVSAKAKNKFANLLIATFKEAEKNKKQHLFQSMYYRLISLPRTLPKPLLETVERYEDFIRNEENERIETVEHYDFTTLAKGHGIIRDVWVSAYKFTKAETAEEALEHAQKLNAFFNDYDPLQSAVMFDSFWPNFKNLNKEIIIKDQNISKFNRVKDANKDKSKNQIISERIDEAVANGSPYELPWNKHRKWATDESVQGHDQILKALHRYNILDPRIPKKPADFASINYRNEPYEYLERDYDIDHDGHIIGSKHTEPSARFSSFKTLAELKASERTELDLAEAKSKTALQNVAWGELETNFEGFIKKHHKHLAPQLSLPELQTEQPEFINEFVNRTIRLYEQNPLIFGPKLNAFFSDPDQKESKLTRLFNNVAGVRKDKTPKTFLGLVKYFQSQTDFRSATLNANNNEHPKGLSLTHPYMRLLNVAIPVTKDKRAVVSALVHFDIYKDKLPTLKDRKDDLFNIDVHDALNYPKPTTGKELIKTVKMLTALLNKRDQNEIKLSSFTSLHSCNYEPKILSDIIQNEIYSFLIDYPEENIDFYDLNAARSPIGLNIPNSPYMRKKYANKKKKIEKTKKSSRIVNQWNRRNQEFDAAVISRMEKQLLNEIEGNKCSVKKLVQLYAIYSSTSFGNARLTFFKHRPDLRDRFEDYLVDRLGAMRTDIFRKARLQNLLFQHNIESPEMRERLVNMWVDTQHRLIENEHGWKWDRKLKNIADKVISGAKKGQALPMLSGLIEKLECQEKECFMVRDKLIKGVLSSGQGMNGLLASMGDHAMSSLGKNKKLGKAMLEFFTSPLTDKNALNTYDELYKLTEEEYFDDRSEFASFLKQGKTLPDVVKADAMANLHKNFWSLPFPARTIYLERILFPVDQTGKREFDQAVNYVLNTILPQGEPYSEEARLILSTHMDGCSKPMQRLILSAMMTASEKTENNQGQSEIRPGQVLSIVLTRSGAAGGKILQAIHSYLQSRDTEDADLIQFRDDLKTAKSDFNRPYRWEIFERLRAAMPKNTLRTMSVGKLLGSGSYGYTVEKNSMLGWLGTSALTLLRPDVAYQAQHQFAHFRETAEKLSKIDTKWEPLVGILKNAEEMSEIEADFNIAGEQIRYAVGLYNSYKIKTDNQSFKIKTAPLYDCGDEYKDVGLGHGEHFNDLPENNAKEKSYKQAAAKALFTAEIAVMLSGKAFDYDRHGAQQRIKGGNITLFDHGSLMYDLESKKIKEPSEEEKQVLGTIIANVYQSTQQKDSTTVMSVLMEQLSDTSRYGDAAQFVESFKRGILALGDFRRSMGQTDSERNKAVEDAIKAVMFSGGVDAGIMNTILEKIDPDGALRENAQGNTPQADAIQIKQHGGATFENRRNAVRSYMLSFMKDSLAKVQLKIPQSLKPKM